MYSTIRRSARWLAVIGAATATAAIGATAPAHADTAQPGHVYRITTNASLALDVSGASQGDNTAVIQWPVNGGPNQSWRLQQLGDGSYYIINVNSGKCLSVYGPSLAAGAGLVQYTCYGAPTQEWFLDPVNSGTEYSIRSAASANVVDVPGGQTATWGTQLEQWSANAGSNQQFFFTTLA
jgi:Ricin-type beta-trefoil lectin domain-like